VRVGDSATRSDSRRITTPPRGREISTSVTDEAPPEDTAVA
jgi:hypothetical protein